jgi:hypothetical protein
MKEANLNKKACTALVMGWVGTIGVLGLAGCASSDQTAEKAWTDALNACERMTSTDQRQSCQETAMRNYQSALKTSNTSTCPKNSC